MKLQRIEIQNLYNKNYKIPVENNRLIIVADNGSGKTTILRLTYLFLTKQWEKIAEYEIDLIKVLLNDKEYIFDNVRFKGSKISKIVFNELADKYPAYSNFITREFSTFTIDELRYNPFIVDEIEQQFDVPRNLISALIEDVSDSVFNYSIYNWDPHVIYLPTYRRIERDYSVLFGDLDRRVANYITTLFPDVADKIHIEKELSEFGYSDTEEDINNIFSSIIKTRNSEKWLRSRGLSLNEDTIEFGMEDVQVKVADHFLLHKDTSLIERFCQLINKYFREGKKLTFEKDSEKLYIIQEENYYNLTSLSSGEKQLLSIFCHLLFDTKSPFLIIDEPEISLSLSWQEMLLEDISATECIGIVAATHSPFVVSENFRQFTHGINEFIY